MDENAGYSARRACIRILQKASLVLGGKKFVSEELMSGRCKREMLDVQKQRLFHDRWMRMLGFQRCSRLASTFDGHGCWFEYRRRCYQREKLMSPHEGAVEHWESHIIHGGPYKFGDNDMDVWMFAHREDEAKLKVGRRIQTVSSQDLETKAR
ncbi:hypothetical protein AK812_SmicGene37444 [Symbiodinium microadriaticum]|uniref:Uncharacterized protein n=1 Tax=Symbiodinium microadriaticum TaxID=2951 RepID=A0A1Q9CG94_SYMMI|nr:hypothetical protein AK812_SmicGene37444 [Symbiodinium microadriaticum]